ncbi:MAG: D-lyxose/D-mannose family sugar isomerase [Acidobacteriota bacterium]|nr:D-lyxose/D-mannose family sugar isomerase [Acidobacteriota bacterium]
MNKEDVEKIRKRAAAVMEEAGIVLRPEEAAEIEVSDFGLGDILNVGLQVVVYVNTGGYCAKDIILFPRQICPEHRHPPVDERNRGKQETFRCRRGEVYLYIPGEPAAKPNAVIPEGYRKDFTVWREIVLKPGDQHTLAPNTLHWFQAGDEGAVLSEFSSTSTDENDIWTDARMRRLPEID